MATEELHAAWMQHVWTCTLVVGASPYAPSLPMAVNLSTVRGGRHPKYEAAGISSFKQLVYQRGGGIGVRGCIGGVWLHTYGGGVVA